MTATSRYRLFLDSLRRQIPELPPDQALLRMREGPAISIDLRQPREWTAGHLPRAINLQLDRLPEEVDSRIPDAAVPILCYSRVGNRSLLAADLLVRMGFPTVYSLAGGWQAWLQAALPVEAGSYPPCRPPDERLAGVAQLPHLIDSIRRLAAGLAPSIASFLDKEDRAVMEFLCVDPQTMEQVVLSSGSDAEVVALLKRILGPSWPTDHAIREFNQRILQRRKRAEPTHPS
ncbi:putative Rhodanese-related sulfurtransferase [Methylacidimicrobium sp. AP8]|uniref:rhodanese-like domain-containing protein n=1 Tax=Methylacidimicrobium sp. AP8 TaxID=2730359 RepID=UPI0018C04966|nr:rhodanese-like domain-containing protein [Methylacidimicrobium sp. AP8]CAB4244680.1 putative Rhodanese-related sulfurtransferase [Methylacidimicrobium sp. AP8]